MRARPAAVLAASTLAFGAAPATASPADDTMIASISRDLGISHRAARAALAGQADAQRVIDRLAERGAGVWLDERTGAVVVAVTDDAAAARVRAAGAEPRRVTRSRADLDRLARAVGDHAIGVPGVFGWGVDVVNNDVVVRVDTTRVTSATRAFLARAADLGARVHETSASPVPQGGDIRPGNPWFPGFEANCSIGFPAVDASGGRHFLTAGHCTDDRDQPAYAGSGGQNRIGTSNTGGTRSVFAREGDMGVVAVTEPGWALSAEVNTWGGAGVTVTGSTEPLVNQVVCHSGVASRWQCGRVTAVEQTVVYASGPIDGMAFTTACSLGGDSGGAWLAGDKAVGLHSGGKSSCSPGGAPDQSLFQPVNEALRKWGLTLHTAGGGDTQAPTAPGNLRATGATSTSASLAWTASTDNVGVTAYDVYTGSTLAASTSGTTATLTGLTPGTSYQVSVRARDAAGNTSPAAGPITVRTSDGSGGTRTFTNDTDYPIQDYQYLYSPIRSTASGAAVSPVRVEVTGRHTCVEDLDIYLLSPSNRWYRLHAYGGSVCHPFPGTATYSAPVTGEQAAGTWNLYIRDSGPGDTGVLDRWSITL
ncbi:fibronectin type III domain-containing protein [Actinokineospora sp. UTMC 2448]|uniref:fibronectin type III domain-containing protein n=1 Tax=Actinokineospora sp. UTMC 2448 TaxID=2268449 RepID=UPI002164CC64|nr:proprotein convertase P-domain-containing protein [Actinokineospora sp. UTMC 2448]UVS79551.1 Streptogrisin-D precursor [Actinokineospora sp. UTMC 2448]